MESPNSNYKNLASILLTNAGNSSDATIVVDDADAAVMPAAPFYATIMPTTELANSTNSEIIFVSASSSSGGETTYTVSRGQRGTTAQSWDAGKAVMTQAVYTQDVQAQKQGYYNAALSSGSAFTIINASAPTTPVLGSRISAVFDTAITTASAITLAINGGTAYPVAVSGVSFDSVGTLTTSIKVATGKVYDMIFDGTEWVIANSFGKITSDNIDYTTLQKIANVNSEGVPFNVFVQQTGRSTYITASNIEAKTATIPNGLSTIPATVPSGFRPDHIVRGVLTVKGISAGSIIFIEITNAGAIRTWNTTGSAVSSDIIISDLSYTATS